MHATYFFPRSHLPQKKMRAWQALGISFLPCLAGGNSFQLMVILLTAFKHATGMYFTKMEICLRKCSGSKEALA